MGTAEIKPITPQFIYSDNLDDKSFNEGESASITIKGVGLAAQVYWSVNGTAEEFDFDIDFDQWSGNAMLSESSSIALEFPAREDFSTEGIERFRVSLYSDIARQNLIGQSDEISVVDASTEPDWEAVYSTSVPGTVKNHVGSITLNGDGTISFSGSYDDLNETQRNAVDQGGFTTAYAGGYGMYAAQRSDGSLLVFGYATNNDSVIAGLLNSRVEEIAFNYAAGAARLSTGQVITWGHQGYYEGVIDLLGDDNSEAIPIIRGNSLYTVVPGPRWTEAEANAVKLGGHLVSIENAWENKLLTDAFGIKLWIGLSDKEKKDEWSWVNGSESQYNNWLRGFARTDTDPYTYAYLAGFREGTAYEHSLWDHINDDLGSAYWSATGNLDPAAGDQGIAEIPFIRRGDSAYVIVQGPTWEEAEANAVALGGHLVTINDAEENEWISRNYSQKGDLSLYIGLHQGAGESWIWSDDYAGEGYQNWHQGQPSPGETIAEIILGDLGWANDPNPTGFLNNVPNPSPYASRGLAEIKLAPNNIPTRTPTIFGDLKVGSTLTIDSSAIQDADNFTGYTPVFKYAWESSTDGITWNKLTTPDATDDNNTYTLTTAEVGKQIRGVVSYVDGYGTNEVVESDVSLVTPIIRGNSLYTIVDGPSWTQAEANSACLGGNLVTINSLEENEFVYQMIGDLNPRDTPSIDSLGYEPANLPASIGPSFWIGLSEYSLSSESFVYKWSEPSWASGENYEGLGVSLTSNYFSSIVQNAGPRWSIDSFYAIVGGNGEDARSWIQTNKVGGDSGVHLYETTKGIAEIPFIRRGDSAYVIVQGPTWEEAEANAVALGGHLVTINDAEENEWITENILQMSTSQDLTRQSLWIGLTDKTIEGNWRWASGEEPNYTNWFWINPNNDGNEDYAEIYIINSEDWQQVSGGIENLGKWNDTENESEWTHGLAEIPLPPNNKPTGSPTLNGDFKVDQTISIDASAIKDADNFAGYTPVFKYSWESSTDGTTWNKLITTDATDEDNIYTLTTAEVGKQIRGVVSYMDGYGTTETLTSDASVKIEAQVKQPIIRGNSLYTIVDGLSWTQAEANSVKLGGHLITLNNKEEYQWGKQSIWTTPDKTGTYFFTGFNDSSAEGDYRWSSGESTDWANITDLIHRQNWNDQQMHFGGWDYGILPFNDDGFSEIHGFGRIILVDETASFYRSYGAPIAGIAETPFIRRGDSAYVIVQGPTWEEAEANAVALGGHLVTINDATENQFIYDAILAQKADNMMFIGMNDADDDGNYSWSSGESSSYLNWGVGEPSMRSSAGEENYGFVLAFNSTDPQKGKWFDTTLDGNGGNVPFGIAEIKLDPNNNPTGTPTLSGNFKAGQVITIDKTPIQDADNFEGWTPTFKYTWEVANDPAPSDVLPQWEPLNTADANDGDEELEITDDLIGKLIRGVVSYVDGYGTNETVYSSEAKVEASVPTQRLISLPTDLTAKVGQIIEVPITINHAQDLQALDLNFAFDPALFSVPTSGGLVRTGSLTSSWTFTGNLNTSTNTLKVSGFSSESLSAVSGDLAYLRLQVKGTAPRGEAVLDLISASLNENELSVELQDGSLTITAPKVSITSDLKAPIGGSIGIPITIDDASDLQSIDLVFAYDPTIFSLPSSGEIISGSDLTGNWSFAANTATPGEIKISGYGTTPLEGGEGGLVNLNLKINSGIDTGNVLLDLVSASFNEGAITADLIDGTLELLPPTFQVLDVRQTASGLALKLSEAPDLEKLNIYDGQDKAVDLPDLRLTRNDGTAVEDLSLHWKAETSELYVIHTDSLTGISQNQFAAGASPFQSDLLAAGDYTLVIDARSDGLVSASSGELIDGNGDGITGDALSYSFTKSTPENLISIGDTTRGSGQSLGLNGIAHANGINGLPVLVSTSAAIRSLRGTVTYDATAFNNASLVVGRDLPDDWTLETQEDALGSLNYTASGTTAITGTDQELFRFDAVVSQDAPYGASTLIEATVEAPEDPTLTFGSDPSLVALAYSGDTTGNGGHSSLDASRIQRVVVGLDSGFDPYDMLAPTLIGDTTGNGGLSSLDASRVQQEVVGLPVTSFPSIPDPFLTV